MQRITDELLDRFEREHPQGITSQEILDTLASHDIKFSEVYPPELPDLFHGGQLVVLGRYSGKGPAAIKLSGALLPVTWACASRAGDPAMTRRGSEADDRPAEPRKESPS